MGWHGPRGSCGCCACEECESLTNEDWEWIFNLCPEDYVDDPDLDSTENSFNSSQISTAFTNMNALFSSGGVFGGTFAAPQFYGPVDRSGVDYEGYQVQFEFSDRSGDGVPGSINVWVDDECDPVGSGEFSTSVSWDEFYLVWGCEWPVDDKCHPRFYWGIVTKTSGASVPFSWMIFSEDLGAGPTEAEWYPSTLVFIPPVLPAASSTECERPTYMPGYSSQYLYTFTPGSGYCIRNPFVNAALQIRVSGDPVFDACPEPA